MASDSAVVEDLRRWGGWQRQIDGQGMPLVGSNHRAIRIQCEALLVTTRDYRLEIRSSKRFAVTDECVEKVVNEDPTTLVECEADCSWLMA